MGGRAGFHPGRKRIPDEPGAVARAPPGSAQQVGGPGSTPAARGSPTNRARWHAPLPVRCNGWEGRVPPRPREDPRRTGRGGTRPSRLGATGGRAGFHPGRERIPTNRARWHAPLPARCNGREGRVPPRPREDPRRTGLGEARHTRFGATGGRAGFHPGRERIPDEPGAVARAPPGSVQRVGGPGSTPAAGGSRRTGRGGTRPSRLGATGGRAGFHPGRKRIPDEPGAVARAPPGSAQRAGGPGSTPAARGSPTNRARWHAPLPARCNRWEGRVPPRPNVDLR